MDKYLYILPLLFPLIVILDFIKTVYFAIKSKDIISILSNSVIIIFVITLTILYLNLILNISHKGTKITEDT
jgi:lipid-A-disaccharide synthase-like uncharacterized protein